MSSKPRYVFDTNTIVSAFLFNRSKPGRALEAALDEGAVLLSEETADELSVACCGGRSSTATCGASDGKSC